MAGASTARAPRIVIVGGGIAGILLATRLGRRGGAEVTLVDCGLSHVWKPMLHTFAAGTAHPDRQKVDFLAQARAAGFGFRAGRLVGIDRAAREIAMRPLGEDDPPPTRLGYDRLVLAIGSRVNDFGTRGVADHCLAIDDLGGAVDFHARLRQHLLASLREEPSLDVAIVGGGATGVELAAELKHAIDLLAAYGSPSLPRRFGLALIESGPRLLPAFPERVSQAAARTLANLGVDVRTGTEVMAADATGYDLKDGSRIAARLKVWAAGVKAPDVLAGVEGLERSKAGQLAVDSTLRTTRDPAILAVGDCASLEDPETGKPVPATAQAAVQQVEHLARHADAWRGGGAPPLFRYREKGALVSLADYNGWGTLGRYTFGGGRLNGLTVRLAHDLLYRQHQVGLLGPWRGGMAWLVDALARTISPAVRLD